MRSSAALGTGIQRMFVDVALPVPLRRLFTYRVPSEQPVPSLGARVAVPFHGRKLAGVVVAMREEAPTFRTRDVIGVLDGDVLFQPQLIEFLREAADYYLHPLGEVLRVASPALRAGDVAHLKSRGAITRAGDLAGKRVRGQDVTVVKRSATPVEGRLGAKQAEVLAVLDARTALRTDELEKLVPRAKSVLGALEKKGLISLHKQQAEDRFFEGEISRDTPPEPTEEQASVLVTLEASVRSMKAETFLLHGVTGAGKTEVYLRTISTARELGRGAILMVPEIALTPQLVGRFRARFGDAIAVLHSGLTDVERDKAWRSLRRGGTTLAIGARSALFAPVENLGVIVVDEEHDGSYKQEEGFRYQARDMAVLRAHRANALCLLGSATPSLESFHNAGRGAYSLLTLTKRATERALPKVEVVDLTRTGAGPSGDPLLTLPLHRALEATLESSDQAILFLNRRGFSPTLLCKKCGTVASCPACSVSLTEHRKAQLLRCHYCDYTSPIDSPCLSCGSKELEPLGLGTEKVEHSLERVFPSARVARLDRDVASGQGVEEVLDRVRRGEVDVLVGTQMVTKGHDLPGVTLVGVLLADQSLAFPDFRSSERTFQLLTQVAGRAGRGAKEGRVLLQTYQPFQPAIVHAVAHDYETFARDELETRQELVYPPFGRLIAIRIDAPDEKKGEEIAAVLALVARGEAGKDVEVLGPAPAPIARIRGRFRFRVFLKGKDRKSMRKVALAVLARIEEGIGAARATIDVDPVSML